MLEKILDYERETFFLLNGSNSAYLDRFMWLFSGKAVWLPLAAFIVWVLIYKKNWRESLLILLAVTLVVALCDQFASHLCKPLFTRFRPTHHPDFMNQVRTVFDYRGGMYGFMSSHAANAFGFVTFMTLLMRNRLLGYALFAWAALTAYSRVYLGVHFISDIVPGALIGTLFGWLVYLLYRWTRLHVLPGARTLPPEKLYADKEKRLIVYALGITVAVLLLLNAPLAAWLH